MPYPNYELGGFKADVGNIGTGEIVSGVQAATEVHRGLVAGLRDGNEFVPANNKRVEQLEAMGERSLSALQAVVRDEHFPGRGYAAWALASVLKVTGTRPPEAMELLEQARSSSSGYVSELARSGLSILD